MVKLVLKIRLNMVAKCMQLHQICGNVAFHNLLTSGSSAVNGCRQNESPNIYIYAFIRRFYPKRFTVHPGYTFFVSMGVPWELNPQPFALLAQCATTETQEHLFKQLIKISQGIHK